jgi:hypothetical protein
VTAYEECRLLGCDGVLLLFEPRATLYHIQEEAFTYDLRSHIVVKKIYNEYKFPLRLISQAIGYEDICGIGGVVLPFLNSAVNVGDWSVSQLLGYNVV